MTSEAPCPVAERFCFRADTNYTEEVVPCKGGGNDRGRESEMNHSPSLRTGQADFPHPALQSVVLPTRGLTRQGRGRSQREQPLLSEESVRRLPMFPSRFAARSVSPVAEQTAQPHPYPLVQSREGEGVAVLEVLKPAYQGPGRKQILVMKFNAVSKE